MVGFGVDGHICVSDADDKACLFGACSEKRSKCILKDALMKYRQSGGSWLEQQRYASIGKTCWSLD